MTNKNDAGKTAAEHPVVRYVNQVRVRYNDTDRMSFVYHANYAMYFEVSRLEMLRARRRALSEKHSFPVRTIPSVREFHPLGSEKALRRL